MSPVLRPGGYSSGPSSCLHLWYYRKYQIFLGLLIYIILEAPFCEDLADVVSKLYP